jgi:acetyl esterase/lipase
LLSLFATVSAIADDGPPPVEVKLWPGTAPGETGSVGEEKTTNLSNGTPGGITNVSVPTITVYRPDPSKNTGLAIVVCPGGGYNMLAWDHEGLQVAEWLKSLGVTTALLKYRVPRRADSLSNDPPPQALMDVQRAIAITRTRAEEWGIDPKRVGVLGFSAGGHLAVWASTRFEKAAYEAFEPSQTADLRPAFAVVIYPGGVVKRGTSELSPEIAINSKTPPMFLAMSNDDPVGPENAAQIYLALKRAGVPAELHVFASGGHGYGMRKGEKPCASWPSRCEEWLRDQHWLEQGSKENDKP